MNRACFPKENTRIHKKGEIHELFVLALSLVWFAGASPEPLGPADSLQRIASEILFARVSCNARNNPSRRFFGHLSRRFVFDPQNIAIRAWRVPTPLVLTPW